MAMHGMICSSCRALLLELPWHKVYVVLSRANKAAIEVPRGYVQRSELVAECPCLSSA